MKAEKAGEYAFLVCILVALIAGLAAPWISPAITGYVSVLLVVLGVVIGLTTITEKETTPFLVAAIALIVSVTGAVGFQAINFVAAPVGSMIQGIVVNIATFTATAAIIIAVKAVYALASKK